MYVVSGNIVPNDVTTKVNSDDLAMLCYMPGRDDFEKVRRLLVYLKIIFNFLLILLHIFRNMRMMRKQKSLI